MPSARLCPSLLLLQFVVDCNNVPNMPTLYFAISGTQLWLPPSVYVLNVGVVLSFPTRFCHHRAVLPRRKSEFPSQSSSLSARFPSTQFRGAFARPVCDCEEGLILLPAMKIRAARIPHAPPQH